MVKLVIPDDWDGETWQCVAVQWPSSPRWLSILRGLLTQPMRGRLWDEKTGTITEAQAVGWQIFLENVPLTDCETGEAGDANVERMDALGGSCGCWDEMELSMPCIDVSRLLKIVDGILYAKDDCCEWVAVGEIGAGVAEVISNPFDDDDTGPFYACGKAAGILGVIYAIVEHALEATALDEYQWEAYIRSAADSFTLGRAAIYRLVINAYAALAVSSEGTILDEDRKQRWLCQLAPQLADDVEVTDSEYEAFKQSVSAFWLSDNLGAAGNLIVNVFIAAREALGVNDGKLAMQLGAKNASADCGCPTVYHPPSEGWWVGEPITFVKQSGGAEIICHDVELPYKCYGFWITKSGTTGDTANFKRMSSGFDECAPNGTSPWGDTSDNQTSGSADIPQVPAAGEGLSADQIVAITRGQFLLAAGLFWPTGSYASSGQATRATQQGDYTFPIAQGTTIRANMTSVYNHGVGGYIHAYPIYYIE